MAQHTTVSLNTGAWVQLTNADAAAARVQNQGPYEIYVQATANTTPPTAGAAGLAGALYFRVSEGFEPTSTLANLFPGITSPVRLWAICTSPALSSSVSVSHA